MKNLATMKKKDEVDASSDMPADHMAPGALVLAGRSRLLATPPVIERLDVLATKRSD